MRTTSFYTNTGFKRNIIGAVVACQIACMSFGDLRPGGEDVLDNPYIYTPAMPGVSKLTPEEIRDENFPTIEEIRGNTRPVNCLNIREFTSGTSSSDPGTVIVSLFNGLAAQAIYHYTKPDKTVAAVLFTNATHFGSDQCIGQKNSSLHCCYLKGLNFAPIGIGERPDLGEASSQQLCYAPVLAVLRNPAFVTPAEGFCLQGLPLIYLPYQFRKKGNCTRFSEILFDHYQNVSSKGVTANLIFSAVPFLSVANDFDGTAFHSVNVKEGNISNELVAALRAYASSWDKFNCGRPDKDCNCTGRNLPENAEAFRNFMQMLMFGNLENFMQMLIFGNLESLRAKIEATELSLKGLMARGMSLDESIVDPLRMVGRDKFLKSGAELKPLAPEIASFVSEIDPLFEAIKELSQRDKIDAQRRYFNCLCTVVKNQVRLAVASGCSALVVELWSSGDDPEWGGVLENLDEDMAAVYGWAIETYSQGYIKDVVIAGNMDSVKEDGTLVTNTGRWERFRKKMIQKSKEMKDPNSSSMLCPIPVPCTRHLGRLTLSEIEKFRDQFLNLPQSLDLSQSSALPFPMDD